MRKYDNVSRCTLAYKNRERKFHKNLVMIYPLFGPSSKWTGVNLNAFREKDLAYGAEHWALALGPLADGADPSWKVFTCDLLLIFVEK